MNISGMMSYIIAVMREHGVDDEDERRGLAILLNKYDPEQRPEKPIYDRYFKSSAWRRIRTEKLEKDQECFVCGEEDFLQVHHHTYDRFLLENPDTDLECLCTLCHETFHVIANIFVSKSYLRKHVFRRGGSFIGEDGCFRYGKNKGLHFLDVDTNYLNWVYETSDFDSDREWIEDAI